MAIRVSIVEDDDVTRESLEALIKSAKGLTCLGAYRSGKEATREIPLKLPDVVLMDINLPLLSGVECTRELKRAHPKLHVLILTTFDDSERIFESLRAGASGYILKREKPQKVLEAIEDVYQGNSPMSTEIARKVVAHFHTIRNPRSDVEKLTAREQEVLAHLAKGLFYKEIGAHLGITPATVRVHLHTIYGKLHVQSRTEAVVKFLEG